MMVANSRASAEWSRYLVVGMIFAVSVAGMLLRPVTRTPEATTHRPELAAHDARLGVSVAAAPARANLANRVALAKGFADLPLRFEENRGQTDSQVRFLSRGSGYAILLAPSEIA